MPETFELGTRVVWNPEMGYHDCYEKYRKAYGEGPFEIADIRVVKRGCDCGKPFGNHLIGCAEDAYPHIGHPQVVKIKLPDGRVAWNIFTKDERETDFSGLWFLAAA